MTLGAVAQWAAFLIFALIAVGGGLGMAATMSMFRSAIFLMASFIGVAGLFILLAADLLGMLQIMMYIGGMLVMAVFMVLFTDDPGGEMMASHMRLPPIERFFSSGLAHMKGHGGGGHGDDMSMFTAIKRPAVALALATGAGLVALLLSRPAWPTVTAAPDPDSARRVGHLLMGRYMMAFEGAGLLILLGIFGAVYVSRPGAWPDPPDRDRIRAAVDQPPAPIAAEDERP